MNNPQAESNSPRTPWLPVLIINFLIMVYYANHQPRGIGVVHGELEVAFWVFMHFVLALIIGIILSFTRYKHIGQALIQAAVILPLISYGWCSFKGMI